MTRPVTRPTTAPTTFAQLTQLWHRLPEADRLRLLQFAQAMLVQKAGKRQTRQKRAARAEVEGWQIGE